jgi:hypothetical protein
MSLTDGHQAIISRIVTEASGVSVALPNGPGKSLPRYVVQEAGGSQRTTTLEGLTDAVPEVLVSVETEAGKYATQNNQLVKQLVQMFPPGLVFGNMKVRVAPDARPPLPVSDGVYAVPVIVRAEFSF